MGEMFDRVWFTNDGPLVQQFEREIANYLGVKHCVAVCNATVGLEIAVRAMGMTGEVIVPSYTFVATAHALGIPAMVHTGPGVPFALPSLCIPAARKYPGLNIILAHAGFAVFSAEAQVAASVCGNLYLETSWCIGEDIRWMINTIGPNRVMMGADLPSNVPVEVAKYKALDLSPEVFDQVMGTTAIDVFQMKW